MLLFRFKSAEIRTFRRLVGCAVALSIQAFVALGCGSGRERPGYLADDGGLGGAGHSGHLVPCTDGEQRLCTVKVDQANGILSCWEGVHTCEDGTWSACGEGTLVKKPDPAENEFDGDLHAHLAGPSATCINQPCDPSCQFWAETTGVTGGGSACAHDVCTPGGALEPGCSACAQTVCAIDATCCGLSWDDECASLAYTACLGTQPPLSLCDFGLFSSGTNQLTITGLQTQSNVMIGGKGNITVQSSPRNVRRIITLGPVTSTADVSPPGGITAGGNISMYNNTYSTVGPLESGGEIAGQQFRVLGDAKAKNQIWAGGSSYVTQTASAGTSVYVESGCGSACQPNSGYLGPTIVLPAVPALTFTCPNVADQTYTADVPLVPGNYGDYHIENNRLILDATADPSPEHVYVFEKLYVKDIELRGTGRFTIRSCAELNLMQNGTMYETPTTKLTDPTRLYFEVKGNLHFQSDVNFIGVVNAASSGSKSGGSITGAIWATPANDINNQQFITGMTVEQCLGMALPGTGRPACTVPTGPVGGTGEKVEEYVADCSGSPGTAPRWGLLTWDSDMTGAGTGTFEARIGADAASAAANDYELLGTATAALPDCHLGMPLPCPVDITGVLELGRNQGKLLQLRVRANPSGGTATIEKWRLTYSCVFDQ